MTVAKARKAASNEVLRKLGHDVAVADVERADHGRMVHGLELGREPDRVGRVAVGALDEEGLDGDPHAQTRRKVAHLPQGVALERVQPVELVLAPHRDEARMVDHHRGADRGRELQHGPADLLVELEVGLIHEVDGEVAVDGVAEAATGADPFQPAAHLGQDPASGDELGGEERKLAMRGAHFLDLAQGAVEVGEVRLVADRAEAEAGDPVVAHA